MSKKTIEVAFDHMGTKIKIKANDVCSNCVYKLYAKDEETVTLGIGNIHSNFIFILPSYDPKSKLGYVNLLTILKDAYSDVFNRDIFNDVYVTRLVKCSKNTTFNLYESAISPCSHYLTYEVNRLVAKHIIFFGSTFDDYQNNNTVAMYLHNKYVYKAYSPAVLLYDNIIVKDKFFNELKTILSSMLN